MRTCCHAKSSLFLVMSINATFIRSQLHVHMHVHVPSHDSKLNSEGIMHCNCALTVNIIYYTCR